MVLDFRDTGIIYWVNFVNQYLLRVWLDKTSGTFFMIAAIFSKLLCNLREVQYFIDGIRRPLNLSNDEKSYLLKNMIGIGRIKLIVTEAGISMHVAYSKGTNLRHSARHKVSHFFGIITNLFMFETLREKITCTERIKNRNKNPQETYLVKCYRNCKRFDYITTYNKTYLVEVFAKSANCRNTVSVKKAFSFIVIYGEPSGLLKTLKFTRFRAKFRTMDHTK